MAAEANAWLLNKSFPWPTQPATNKVDTHHHWVPAEYANAVADAGGDPSGWATPEWSLQSAELLMGRVGISTAILSVTAPGACILDGQASFELARRLNDQAAALRDAQPQKFGFFASLPSLLDTRAALAEIAHAFDALHADGVCLFTRYGAGNAYLGHADLEPVWAELDRRRAVVFVHPTHQVDTAPVNARMPQPMIDYPHETTRAAMDMLIAGTLRKFPRVKVILSHAGGTLPWIIGRVATPLAMAANMGGAATPSRLTHEQLIEDFRSFYFDVALSTSAAPLRLLLEQVPMDHILFGSDFPYAPPPAYPAFLKELEDFDMTQEQRDQLNFKTARQLFPRLQNSAKLA